MCDKVIDRLGSVPEWQYRCKTLIVGAGLAGASLGFLLRKAGDDVLLRTGTRTCFVGDAAGLIHNITGAGISYALTSARRLAQAFLEGDSYEEMMRPLAEDVVQLAKDAKKAQFLTRFTIMKRGAII